ncbi:MAG: peptidase dimerization domain-containing protein [Candidatus Heimdallarchaeota archaeon]
MANAGVLYFRVKVLGRTTHAEHAHRGVNAIGKAMKLYNALMLLNERCQKQINYPLVENRAPDMKGHATILNIGVIKGGDWPSTVAGWAELECRIGWPPGEILKDVKTQIEETVRSVTEEDSWLRAHPPKLEWFGWKGEASEQDRTHPFVQLVKRYAEEI